ncbi:MAG: hypothetical protein RLZZ546_1343 [Bacteroidota bacterium]|jgi:hypothetical protein
MKTAVEQLIEKMSLEDVCKYSNELAEAKLMEDEQATEYAKWSLGIYELHARFFTFLEWIKDEPKDEEQ